MQWELISARSRRLALHGMAKFVAAVRIVINCSLSGCWGPAHRFHRHVAERHLARCTAAMKQAIREVVCPGPSFCRHSPIRQERQHATVNCLRSQASTTKRHERRAQAANARGCPSSAFSAASRCAQSMISSRPSACSTSALRLSTQSPSLAYRMPSMSRSSAWWIWP